MLFQLSSPKLKFTPPAKTCQNALYAIFSKTLAIALAHPEKAHLTRSDASIFALARIKKPSCLQASGFFVDGYFLYKAFTLIENSNKWLLAITAFESGVCGAPSIDIAPPVEVPTRNTLPSKT